MIQTRTQLNCLIISFLVVLGSILLLSVAISYLMNTSSTNSYSGSPVYMSLLAFVYFGSFIVVPFLPLRFLYYLIFLLHNGRKEGVRTFSIATLFNPINFLFFPSLLNEVGLENRRRCVITLILLVCWIGLVFYLAGYVPGDK